MYGCCKHYLSSAAREFVWQTMTDNRLMYQHAKNPQIAIVPPQIQPAVCIQIESQSEEPTSHVSSDDEELKDDSESLASQKSQTQ